MKLKNQIAILNEVMYIQQQGQTFIFVDFNLKIETIYLGSIFRFNKKEGVYLYLQSNSKYKMNQLKNSTLCQEKKIKVLQILPLYVGRVNLINKLDKSDYDYRYLAKMSYIVNTKQVVFREIYVLPYHIIFLFVGCLVILRHYDEMLPNENEIPISVNSAINKSNFVKCFRNIG